MKIKQKADDDLKASQLKMKSVIENKLRRKELREKRELRQLEKKKEAENMPENSIKPSSTASKTREKITYFQERDAKLLEKQLLKRNMKSECEKEKSARLEAIKKKVGVTAIRDPKRLLQPTQVTLNHRLPSNDGEDLCFVINSHHKRAIPSWRVGIA